MLKLEISCGKFFRVSDMTGDVDLVVFDFFLRRQGCLWTRHDPGILLKGQYTFPRMWAYHSGVFDRWCWVWVDDFRVLPLTVSGGRSLRYRIWWSKHGSFPNIGTHLPVSSLPLRSIWLMASVPCRRQWCSIFLGSCQQKKVLSGHWMIHETLLKSQYPSPANLPLRSTWLMLLVLCWWWPVSS